MDKKKLAKMPLNDIKFIFRQWFLFMSNDTSPPILSNTKKKVCFYNEALLKDIISLTLTLGCKNKKTTL